MEEYSILNVIEGKIKLVENPLYVRTTNYVEIDATSFPSHPKEQQPIVSSFGKTNSAIHMNNKKDGGYIYLSVNPESEKSSSSDSSNSSNSSDPRAKNTPISGHAINPLYVPFTPELNREGTVPSLLYYEGGVLQGEFITANAADGYMETDYNEVPTNGFQGQVVYASGEQDKDLDSLYGEMDHQYESALSSFDVPTFGAPSKRPFVKISRFPSLQALTRPPRGSSGIDNELYQENQNTREGFDNSLYQPGLYFESVYGEAKVSWSFSNLR